MLPSTNDVIAHKNLVAASPLLRTTNTIKQNRSLQSGLPIPIISGFFDATRYNSGLEESTKFCAVWVLKIWSLFLNHTNVLPD